MLITSQEKLALIKRHGASPPLEDLVATYFTDVDIVLTEGFKMSSLPKIEVHTLILNWLFHNHAIRQENYFHIRKKVI
jgi:molybdopterin-guanine dinucleotide biosynthesis protein MobB